VNPYAFFCGFPPHIVTNVTRHRPKSSRTLVEAITNSDSPYHLFGISAHSVHLVTVDKGRSAYLTATTLRRKQATMTIAIQAAGLISAFQYCITVATAEYSVHTNITPAKKYVHPIANPKAGSTKRDANSKIDPRIGKYAHSSATHKLSGQMKSRPQKTYPRSKDSGPALLRTPPIPTCSSFQLNYTTNKP